MVTRCQNEDEDAVFDRTLMSFTVEGEEDSVDTRASAWVHTSGRGAFPSVAQLVTGNATAASGSCPDFSALTQHFAMTAPAPTVRKETASSKRQSRQRTPDELREQNRLTVQRFYYRKKSLIQGLRDEEARLTQEFVALRAEIRDEAYARKRSKTTTLILVAESLQLENELLRDQIAFQSHHALRFGRVYESACQRFVGETESSLPPVEIIPRVSPAGCDLLVQTTLQEITEPKNTVQTSSGAHTCVLGWDCRVAPTPGTTGAALQQFGFTKSLVSDLSALQVAQRTLDLWTSCAANDHAQLCSPHSPSRLRLLQRIDERNLILLQTFSTNQAQQAQHRGRDPSALLFSSSGSTVDKKTRAIVHVSLVETDPNAVVFFVRSIPPEHYELDYGPDAFATEASPSTTTTSDRFEWISVFNWCTLTRRSLGIVEATCGSRVAPLESFEKSAFEGLICELSRIVRWETAVLDTSLVRFSAM